MKVIQFNDAFNKTFASMNMLNSNLANLDSSVGGKTKWFNFHHSFSDLVNPNEYFDKHPEYFSMIDGKRIKEHTELCLSNPDVFNIALNRVRKWIEDNPECKVFSVAQDEWMGHFIRMACVPLPDAPHTPTMIMLSPPCSHLFHCTTT